VSGVAYAPVGPWWTLDAPSLRLPTRDGAQVSIWTVGEGPSVLLVPRSEEDHRAWLPLLPHLQERFTLHALQRPAPGTPDTAVRDVAVAVTGLGVRQVVADGDSGAAALEALAASRLPALLVLHASPTLEGSERGGSLVVHRVGNPGDTVGSASRELAARLTDLLLV
jgi:hypothetical protein